MGVFRQFPYSNFHELNMDWLLNKVKELSNEWFAYHENMEEWKNDTDQAFADLKAYVENYFEDLDVESEIDRILNELAAEGFFDDAIARIIERAGNVSCNLVMTKFYDYTNDYAFSQSCCYIGNNKFAAYYIKNTNMGIIRIYDTNTWTLVRENEVEAYHGNSLTYNPDTNKIYAVALYSAGQANTILPDVFEIDADTLEIERTIIPPIPTGSMGIYSLAYDIITHKFYAICKNSPAGSANMGEMNRIVTYNEALTQIESTSFMEKPMLSGTQGIQSAYNGRVYINVCSYSWSGNKIYNAETGGLVTEFEIPEYINGYRYLGEFESQFYNYDTDSWYGMSAFQGSGVAGHMCTSFFELGIYKSVVSPIPNRQSFNMSSSHRVTINVNNGSEAIEPQLNRMSCITDAINLANRLSIEAVIVLTGVDVGTMSIVGFNGMITGTSAVHAKFVGGVQILHSKVRFVYCDFSGTITHDLLGSGGDGNIAAYQSELTFVLPTFTSKILISDSRLNIAQPTWKVAAIASFVICTSMPTTANYAPFINSYLAVNNNPTSA